MSVWVLVILAWLIVPAVLWIAFIEVSIRANRRKARRRMGYLVGPHGRSRLPR